MKLLFDLFPLLLFFAALKIYDIYVATAVVMAASAAQVGYFWLRHRRFEKMHLISLGVILLFGGLTLYLQDERFVKWKPTIVNWLFAGVFLFSQFVGQKPLIERMMGHAVELPALVWRRLNLAWSLFFISVGFANIYVMYNYDTETWGTFKVFGILGLTLLFIVVQSLYMSRFIKSDEDGQPSGGSH